MKAANIILYFFLCALPGCASLGIEGPFRNDPVTGGIDTTSSELLNISLPAGLQRYPSHGFSRIGENGIREGLETFRGNINGITANLALFNSLNRAGWQLRLSLRKGDRSVAIYEKLPQLALLTFHRQGMLTILEIWVGPRLADGSILGPAQSDPDGNDADKSLAGEEYEPLQNESADKVEEKWGGELEERDI